ncbi:MAG: hypothetical protein COZ34_02925 [Candidatus Pacebacteria bacterium CG_4_10_14_3_um_filter_34_15]|nr:hypothetical protein [Candidatus Pacearchaeota archaeon]NCQ65338.1 hypothetical protein [Candidatus Paceibacterota bacterium]NCS86933.1 hypothetical protein [Candidatus Paceibacterota bacterium]PIX81531.1 MAG: hypothetical protein COZ34_02925 [Candidatus Pacebacteria bacterium CG_4_10_14_3_um_filter_34_15]
MNQVASAIQEKENNPRNSKLRDLTRVPVSKTVEFLDTAFPWLTPNQITALGTIGVLGLAIYTAALERKGEIDAKTSAKLLATFLALSISDALDGSLARLKKAKGEEHDSEKGQLIDTLSDRLQEAFMAWLSMYRANENGDKLAMSAALVSALTNPLSSFFRSWAEAEGVTVPESGKGIFDVFGTRVGKAIAASVKFMPVKKIGGVSIQAGVDMMVAAVTLKVAVSRFKVVIQARQDQKEADALALVDVEEADIVSLEAQPELNDEEKAEAEAKRKKMMIDGKIRRLWLGGTMIITSAMTLAIYNYLKNQHKNK